MNKTLKYIFLVLLSTLAGLKTHALNQHKIDSLEKELKDFQSRAVENRIPYPSPGDTTRIQILIELGKEMMADELKKGLEYLTTAVELSRRLNYQKGLGSAYRFSGVIERSLGNYERALSHLNNSLKIQIARNDIKNVARVYSELGYVYMLQGNYDEALKDLFQSLHLADSLGELRTVAFVYSDIGKMYGDQGNLNEAIRYVEKSKQLADSLAMGNLYETCLNNLGVYHLKINPLKAEQYFLEAMPLVRKSNNTSLESSIKLNLGIIYLKREQYELAESNFTDAADYFRQQGKQTGLCTALEFLGFVNLKKKNFEQSRKYFFESLKLAEELKMAVYRKESFEGLLSLDSTLANNTLLSDKERLKHAMNALLYHSYVDNIRDSLSNEAILKKADSLEMKMNYDKQISLKNLEAERIHINAQKELQKQKLVRNGVIAAFTIVIFFSYLLFRQKRKINNERLRSEKLLQNILPAEVANELKEKGRFDAKAFTLVSVMFIDIKDFTSISEKISAEILVREIHECFSAFDNIIEKYGIEKIKTIGDSYMCASGLPVSSVSHAFDLINAAMEINIFIKDRRKKKIQELGIGFEIRTGIHSGPVVSGIVGTKKYSYDIWGDTVNIASRLESSCEPGKINISETTYRLVKDKFNFTRRGKISIKNKGEMDMYYVDVQENESSPAYIDNQNNIDLPN
jgi:adenylate cyclase